MKRLVPFLLLAGLLFQGCASLTSHREPEVTSLKRIYVEHLLTDNYRTDQSIVAELKQLGYEASCGPLTMMPEGVDAIVTYGQRSQWDFKSYLIELSIDVKANFSGKLLARGRYYQPTIRTKSPEETVHIVVESLFKRR